MDKLKLGSSDLCGDAWIRLKAVSPCDFGEGCKDLSGCTVVNCSDFSERTFCLASESFASFHFNLPVKESVPCAFLDLTSVLFLAL